MEGREDYATDGYVLRRDLLPRDDLARLVDIGTRLHARWLARHGDDARRHDLVNGHAMTASRYFPPPHDRERAALFDALAAPALVDAVTTARGDGLSFHGLQTFFNPLGGRRRPYWHRDLQYLDHDETRQRSLLAELRNLHVRIPLRPESRFLLVPGSHRRWDTAAERDVRLELAGHTSDEDLATARAFALAPGDVLVFSAHMLHRGTYEGNTERLSLDLMVGIPHPAVPHRPERDELPTPTELSEVRRPHWYERAHALLVTATPA